MHPPAPRAGGVAAPPGDQAARLLRLVAAWGVPHNHERSFRMSVGALQADRFLLTANAAGIPGGPAGGALAVCDQLGMPPGLRDAAAAGLPAASAVHFGFEGNPGGALCKLYLERAVPPAAARRAHAAGAPALLHLAFKWSQPEGTAVTARYLWHPLLAADAIARRIERLHPGAGEPRAIATEFLRLAAAGAPAERLQYLEVEEAGTGRRSFDLNLYGAKLSVGDAEAPLQRMQRHFGLPPGQFQALYDQVRRLPLGHVAGGTHRNGEGFFSIYYGATGSPPVAMRPRAG